MVFKLVRYWVYGIHCVKCLNVNAELHQVLHFLLTNVTRRFLSPGRQIHVPSVLQAQSREQPRRYYLKFIHEVNVC
jgi:hypothetical protein